MKQQNYYIYILTTNNNKVMYVGMTNDLQHRIYEHQSKLIAGFTKRYNLTKLVYYENTTDVNSAIQREKEIKKWRREKKNKLVETLNPNWKDLSNGLFYEISPSTKSSLLRNDNVTITGLIISAGLSSRMGKFKPLLQYKGKSFLHNIVDKLEPICDDIVIVTGHNKNLIEVAINSLQNRDKTKTIYNQNYKDGMFKSLQTGLTLASKSNWVLYHFIDQPTLPNNFYNNFTQQIDDSFDWIQPKHEGRKGHPILLGKKVINKILSSDSKDNLKLISNKYNFKKKYFDTKTSSIFSDIDTKYDYETLIEKSDVN